jgi:hypothetical protein
VTPAFQQVGDDERERKGELDQRDHAEAGRESDDEERDEERRSGVLEHVASYAREVLRASPALERGS